MNELIEFLTSKEIIVVYIVALIACALCFVLYIVDKTYYKRKQRHNTRELNKLVEEVNEVIEEEYDIQPVEIVDTPILSPILEDTNQYQAKVQTQTTETIATPELIVPEEEIEILDLLPEELVAEQKEELVYTSVEPDVKQAQEELMRLTAELEKAAQEEKNIDLTAYEEEQEENAIISLEELVRKSKEMYESNEITQYEDEGNEPISLEDLERRMNKIKEETAELETETPVIIETIETTNTEEVPQIIEMNVQENQLKQMAMDDFLTIGQPSQIKEEKTPSIEEAYQTIKKFERSPVISPIYGIERTESVEDIELENTANYEKLDEEIKKTNEFLMTLRELQKNLD